MRRGASRDPRASASTPSRSSRSSPDAPARRHPRPRLHLGRRRAGDDPHPRRPGRRRDQGGAPRESRLRRPPRRPLGLPHARQAEHPARPERPARPRPRAPEPGGPPAGFGYSYSDLAGGNLGALAVLAAIWHRRRTGRGQLVDLAQLETVAAVLGPVLLERALQGGASAPAGNASQEAPAAPHGVYPCAGEERWIAITVFTDAEWERFADAAGGPAWTRDTRFATRAG